MPNFRKTISARDSSDHSAKCFEVKTSFYKQHVLSNIISMYNLRKKNTKSSLSTLFKIGNEQTYEDWLSNKVEWFI